MSATHHIALRCRDRKKQEAFYSKYLGFKRARVFNRGKPDEFVMLRLGSTCIELFQAGPDAAHAKGGEQPIGFMHLAFEVPDIDKAVSRLHADGFKTDNIIDCSAMVPGLRICFFDDPDGNRLELIQGWSDEAI